MPVPDGVGARAAAAVLHDGATAVGLMTRVGVRPGEWVLVLAAAGGIGLLLVQLARAAGARVIGAARTSGTSRALSEAAAGRIEPFIGQVFPLEEAARAHAEIAARAGIGKTLLLVG